MATRLFFHRYDAPTGALALAVDEKTRPVRISFMRGGESDQDALVRDEPGSVLVQDPESCEPLRRWLDLYFSGQFDLDLDIAPHGTRFQQEVWRALRLIPAGETRTYAELASKLGKPRAARAVGRANATNPLPIVVPCHRLIGTDGSLTGYAGGLSMKRWLLELEGAKGSRRNKFPAQKA